MNIANVGGTLTGGATVALSPSGIQAGKSVFVTPDHARLTPQIVQFTTTAPVTTAKDPGVARSGLQISFAGRVTEEGCCTVQQGAVVLDLGLRWSLNQPVELVDDVIDLLRGIVFNASFKDALVKGILPAA
jgi:hypothetical protein